MHIPTLDASHFHTLLSEHLHKNSHLHTNGIPISKELWAMYSTASEAYHHALLEYYEYEIIFNSLEGLKRGSITNILIKAMSCIDYPVSDGCGNGNAISIEILEEALREHYRSIAPFSRLVFGVDDTLGIINNIKTTTYETLSNNTKYQKMLEETMYTVTESSSLIKQMYSVSNTLIKITEPISEAYVETFVQYIQSIIESLELKMQILGMEMRLALFDQQRLQELKMLDTDVQVVYNDLVKTVELGETNLMMFRQLGPTVAKLASEYRHIQSQISLVKEDFNHLSK